MGSSELSATIAALAPFALAGVVVPTWTNHVIILLGTRRPKTNALAFVLGNAAYRLLLGAAALLSISLKPGIAPQAGSGGAGLGVWGVAAGVLLALVGAFLFRKPPRASDELPGWLKALESIRPWMAFGAGFATMAAPGIQYVYFLGGMGVIPTSSLSTAERVVMTLGFTAFLELMLLSPLVIYILGGERSAAAVQSFKIWLGRNEYKVFGTILACVGLLVVVRSF